jgi:TaqI-like C-terminal specificity domain
LIEAHELKTQYPRIFAYLSGFEERLRGRKDSRKLYADGPEWYKHVRPGSFNITNPPKLMAKGIDRRPQVGVLEGKSNFNGANCPGIVLHDRAYSRNYILGILNSSVCAYYLNAVCPAKLNNTYRYNANNLNTVPLVGTEDEVLERLVSENLHEIDELRTSSDRFKTLVREEFGLTVWPDKFNEWWREDYPNLIKGLSVKLTLTQKDELREVWSKYRERCRGYAESVTELDGNIDRRVYQIYKLSDDEIGIIEAKLNESSE